MRQREVLNAYLAEYEKTGIAPCQTELARQFKTTKQNIHNIIKKALNNIEFCPLCGQKMLDI